MKKCPFCAEEIQDEAIKCRYCGEAQKIRFHCEVLDKSGNFFKWSIEACGRRTVEKQVLENDWKMLAIWQDGEPKQIIDKESYVKNFRSRVVKQTGSAWVFVLAAVILLILAALIAAQSPSTSSAPSYRSSAIYDKAYDDDVKAIAGVYGIDEERVRRSIAAVASD